jgi:hypothetical protein
MRVEMTIFRGAITAKMIADIVSKNTTSITRTLRSIGFEVELDRIIVIKDGVTKKKQSRKLVVPSINVRRVYIFNSIFYARKKPKFLL